MCDGVVDNAYSDVDAAQAVLECILQDAGYRFHRTAQMNNVLVVEPGISVEDQAQHVVKVDYTEIYNLMSSKAFEWPITVDLGDGLYMVVLEDAAEGDDLWNPVASKILLITRNIKFKVKGRVIFMFKEGGEFKDVPKWVPVVLKRAAAINVLFY